MAEVKADTKPAKSNKKLWQSVSLLLMILVPPLLLYPGAKGNSGLEVVGYILLFVSMVIPLLLKK